MFFGIYISPAMSQEARRSFIVQNSRPTFESDYHGYRHLDRLSCVDDAIGDRCTVDDSAEYVHQDPLHLKYTSSSFSLKDRD